MLFNKADQAFSRGLHFFGCIISFLDSESVFILARWLDVLFVCMKIKTCACTRWLFLGNTIRDLTKNKLLTGYSYRRSFNT